MPWKDPAKTAAYRLRTRDQRLAQKRRHYRANAGRISAANRDYRIRNPEETRSRAKAYAVVPAHRARKSEQAQEHRLLARAFVDAAMADGCVDCGEKNLYLLELDHVRGKKVGCVMSLKSCSFKRLFAEIDKCETRCANCHRAITAKRQLGLVA